MSFDLNLISEQNEDDACFSIGYSAWMLLDKIFDHKSFWFDQLNEKPAKEVIPLIEKAIETLNNLPTSGVLEKTREYSVERYNSLMDQLNYMLERSNEKKDFIWYISL